MGHLNWDRPEEFASWIALSSERPECKDANPYSVIASGFTAGDGRLTSSPELLLLVSGRKVEPCYF